MGDGGHLGLIHEPTLGLGLEGVKFRIKVLGEKLGEGRGARQRGLGFA